MDGFQLDSEHSRAEKNYSPDIGDEEGKWLQDSREIHQLDRTFTQPQDQLEGHAQAAPMLHRGADRWKSTGGLLPHLTGTIRNQGTAQVSVESVPVGMEGVEIQQPRKGKRLTTPDRAGDGHERKHPRRKKGQQVEALEYIPVRTVGISTA